MRWNVILTASFSVLFLVGGCRDTSVAPATPRPANEPARIIVPGQNQPLSLNDSTVSGSRTVLDSILHQEQFACLSVDFPELRESEELKTLDWPELEKAWQELLGSSTLDLKSVSRCWLLFDRNSLTLLPSAESSQQSPLVLVFEFDVPVNQESLREVFGLADSAEPAAAGQVYRRQQSAALMLDANTLAIGPDKSLERMMQASTSASMRGFWSNGAANDKTLRGRFDIGSIRSQIQPLVDMATQFGGKTVWTRLPDVLTEAQVEVALQGAPFLQIDLLISDEALRKELGQWLTQQAGNVGGGNGIGTGLPGNPASLPGMGAGDLMFQPALTSSLPALVQEIQRDQLLEIVALDDRLRMTLKRPQALPTVLQAAIADAAHQQQLVTRLQAAEKVGIALRAYRDTFAMYPSLVPITGEGSDAKVRRQFSWRVALLPELGYQSWYDEFNFNEDWDSPGNQEVARKIPAGFPLADANGNSRWQLALGSESLYHQDRAQPKPEDITDRRIWTAFALEAAQPSSSLWTDPQQPDVKIDGSGDQWGQADESGVIMINADGQARIVRRRTDLLRAVLTRAGGESLGRSDFIQMETGGD